MLETLNDLNIIVFIATHKCIIFQIIMATFKVQRETIQLKWS